MLFFEYSIAQVEEKTADDYIGIIGNNLPFQGHYWVNVAVKNFDGNIGTHADYE